MILLKKSVWMILVFLPLLAGAQRLPYGLSAKALWPDLYAGFAESGLQRRRDARRGSKQGGQLSSR